MRLRHRLSQLAPCALLSLTLLLSACGGGGSGGGSSQTVGGGGGGGFSVSIARTELRFSGEEGGSLAPQTVTGAGSGTLPPALYLGSLDLGTAIEQVTVEAIGMQAKFTVYPKANLAAGTYTGSVQLFACADEKCATQFPGSPVSVPYTVTIAKGFSVTPASVQLSALSGATASADVAVQAPAGATGFTAASNSAWMSISNQSATGFRITAKAMAPGHYSGVVNVVADGRTRAVNVLYTVTGDSSTVTRIIPDVSSLDFSATATASAPVRTINVTLPSWTSELSATMRYLVPGVDWLSLVKSGSTSYTVTASAAALSAGTYQAEITFASDGTVAPVTVPVTFTVGAASWTLVGQTRFALGADSTAASLSGDLAVGLPNLAPQPYSASSTAPWLKLSRSSGTTGDGPLRLSIDMAEMDKLANFRSYTADIAITAADSRIAPGKLTVTLEKSLPELHYVSPQTRLPGEAGVFTLRGRGLDAYASLEQGLRVGGATPLSVTRVSATEARVQLAGAAAGEVSFTLANALAIPSGAPVLRTLAPDSFPYAAIATEGNKGGLVYDPVRRAVYTANKTLFTVMRFAWTGSGWNVTSASLPGIDAVALSPDGKSLVATSTSQGIVLLDPVSLERQGSYATQVGGERLNPLQRLAVTNDGRAWFQGGMWGGLNYFDLVTREFGSLGGQQYSFYSGPWFSVSGDGSRLNIVQSASLSPSPAMLYLDSGDSAPKVNPAGLNFWYEAAQSLRGERFVEGTYKVWDRDFTLIGELALPDSSWIGRTPVLSPDGSRVYIMAYQSAGGSDASIKPRVFVFDSSTRMVLATRLPLLGYFELADYPTCRSFSYDCDTRALGAISPDGKTLFFLGDSKLVVAPVGPLSMSAAGASMQRAGAAPVIRRVR